MSAPDPRLRWLRFVAPHADEGARRVLEGERYVFLGGDWRHAGPDADNATKLTKRDELFLDYARKQRERVTDFRGVLPEQYAVEVDDGRGGKRVDYVGVPIRNADGTLNKYGKALIEAHETPNKRETDVAAEINATQGAA